MPFSRDVTMIGRDWWIKIKVRRRLWQWQIWTRRCRRSASRYWPTFLGSSRRASWALLKMPPAEIPPLKRGRAAAKGSHGVTVVPRRHRRLHLPRRYRRQSTATPTTSSAVLLTRFFGLLLGNFEATQARAVSSRSRQRGLRRESYGGSKGTPTRTDS